uniref:Polymerase nucleotidyl transferase domain-containing protein n=1 Tax=viral metagenome TaxID=1070528 RepID=A0A6C0IX99_9ZZZZ
MNTNIRQDLPRFIKDFFYNLKNYLDADLYFYGSINRSDYIHGKSDIDLAIFTDNEYSVINQLQHFLHASKSEFKKVIWKLEGQMIYGFKIKCDPNLLNGAECEIAIYNNDFKDLLLFEFQRNDNVPLLLFSMLYILKLFYYKIPIMSKKTYANIKKFLFNKVMNNKDSEFLLI